MTINYQFIRMSVGDTMSGKTAIALALLFTSIGLLGGCSADRRVIASAPETVRNLPIVTAQISSLPDTLEAVGTVRAAQTSSLAAQVMGTIVEVRVHEGDRIQRGEVLVAIDDAQPKATLDRAAAAEAAAQQEVTATDSELTLAESTFRRYQILHEKGIVSPQEFDEKKARQQSALARHDLAQAVLEQTKAEVTQARTTLEYTRILAPFNGIVAERRLDPGALASPGVPILTVENLSRYRLEASVNENELGYLHLGEQVPVLIDALGNPEMKGRVAQIVPAADPGSRTFLVKIELPTDTRLRSGLFGRAQFARGERQSMVVPRTAVVDRGQLQGVFVLDQNKVASLRYLTLGKVYGTNAEVLSGLQSGDRLVANPGELDLSGKRIEVD
jgi:RND family efflux transporter MFP subunit